jgi:UDP-N-acetylmuramoyl-tripeptide--D-alanyl-D-alanine ligase
VTPLWTSLEADVATGGESMRPWHAAGVSIDSRTLAPGDLFIALAGPRDDGHEYVKAALVKGAAAAIVHRVPEGIIGQAPLLVVSDTMKALEDLGRAARARSAASVLAITGSVGKTGTKEALRHTLERFGPTHASSGSLNNHWGVPLSLARMRRDARYAVFELGMNHRGEIEALSRQVGPDVAVITTVEPAHLGFFPTVEAIADAKAEIFAGMPKTGTAVLNRDNPHFERLAAAAARAGISRIYGFGSRSDAAIRLIDCRLHGTDSVVTASVLGEIVDYRVALPGRHWVMNSLAVLGAVAALEGDIEGAAASFTSLAPLEGRGKTHRIAVENGTAVLIDESYNASPASVAAAIAVLGGTRPAPGGRRIAILGDMLELGEASADLHAALSEPIDQAGIDLVFTMGAEMRALYDALPDHLRGGHASSAEAMAEMAALRLRAGDIVTVKGSHDSHMGDVVARLLAAPVYAAKG